MIGGVEYDYFTLAANMHRLLILLTLLPFCSAVSAQTTYEATTKGASCKLNPQGVRYCMYRVGDLEFGLIGVGTKDTAVHFLKSDIATQFYAQVYMQDSCVVVLPGAANSKAKDKAFVSVNTGGVFKSVAGCKGAK